MNELILAILSFATPLVTKAIDDYRTSHDGAMPTDEEMIAALHESVLEGNSEWAKWLAAHPKV